MLEKVEQTVEDIAETLKESTRPIRALNRGLEVLIELNRLQRAAINTLAAAVGLPRTTTYRVLETLRTAGYVHRDRIGIVDAGPRNDRQAKPARARAT